MNRTRTIFLILIAVALVGVGSAAYLQYGGSLPMPGFIAGLLQPGARVPATLAADTQPVDLANVPPTQVTVFAPTSEAAPQPTLAIPAATAAPANAERLKPIWGPNYKENDGLGRIICGAYAFSGDYPLQQIQMAGLDVKHGFHLGIVPFYLNENYVVTAKDRADALANGTLDCLLTTFDLMSLEDPGILTAFINESAGADQIWARGVNSLNDLKGKRIAFEANGPSAFFVYDLLATVQIKPEDVQLLPQANQQDAVELFNTEGADVVAGWEPFILDAGLTGGELLASTRDFRSILGGIVMSRQAMQTNRTVIQLFHDAWFEALAAQETDFAQSAAQIAQWGHNDYLGVKPNTAADDLRTLLGGVAQANLADNVRAFSNVSSIVQRLLQTRQLWALNGHPVPGGDVTAIINPEFVQASARAIQVNLDAPSQLVNNSFSLGRTQAVRPPAAEAAQTSAAVTQTQDAPLAVAITNTQAVATLPCSRFEFVPNTSELQPLSVQQLQDCALRVLKQNVNLYVRVKGSSAWPGPKGTIRRELVESTARERAQAVVDWLSAQGINRDRFIVEWTMPPEDHWETTDLTKQSSDRYVELTLLVSGL